MNSLIKIAIIAAILIGAYWCLSPLLNGKRAWDENVAGDKGVEIVCGEHKW